jgi:hypothetical protein
VAQKLWVIQQKLPLAEILALPWPDEIAVLTADDIDSYVEPVGRGRKHLWEWLQQVFGADEQVYSQFCRVLFDVVRIRCHQVDKDLVNFTSLPSTKGHQPTRHFYSSAEVAAWWNESLQIVGYEVE